MNLKHNMIGIMVAIAVCSCISKVSVEAAPNDNSDDNSVLVSYEIVKDVPDGNEQENVIMYFERPVFESDSIGYKRINEFFEEESRKFMSSEYATKGIWEEADDIEAGNMLDYHVDAEVTCQTDSLISVKLTPYEFHGGLMSVYWDIGYLFLTGTGELINPIDAVGITEEEARQLIDQGMQEQYPDLYSNSDVRNALADYPFKDICFYADASGMLHASFGKYAIAWGAVGIVDIILDGANVVENEDKYKFVYAPVKSGYNNDESISLRLEKGFSFTEDSSSVYNSELALTALALSNEVYEAIQVSENEYESTAQDTLLGLGYQNTLYCYAPKWNAFQPVCCFAYMNDGEKNVFAIIVRGTQNFWSDLVDTDIVDGGTRFFEDATYNVYAYFENFAEDVTGKTLEELKKEDNRFFLAGHSLGGAIANRLSITDKILNLAQNDKNKIYTYTFESPHTCQSYWWMNPEEMSNAFNFKDVDDGVASVPPWFGATRYGTDLEFSVGFDEDAMALRDMIPAGSLPYGVYRNVVDGANRLFLGRAVENLDDSVFRGLFPNAKGGSVTAAPSPANYGNPFGHHDIGLDLTYIIQQGIKADVWKSTEEVLSYQ